MSRLESVGLNTSENTTIFIGDINNFIVLNSILAPLYFLFLVIPSLLSNGVVIGLFLTKKELRTPLNAITINHCFIGLLGNLLNGFLTFIVYPISLSYGSCAIETIIVATTIWTTFGANILNLAALSTGLYITLKYNNTIHKLTYRKVAIVLVVVWTYPALWAALLAYIVRDIRSLRCFLYTDDFVNDIIIESDPAQYNLQGGSAYQIVLYISRDFAVDMVSRTLVIIFCIASYRLFRKSTLNPPEDLTRRMLLLPVLMTIMSTIVNFFSGVLLIAVNNGYGAVSVSVEDFEGSALFYIQTIFQFIVEYNAIAYACLLIYLNNKIQAAYKESFKTIFGWCKHPKHNRVAPQ